MSESRRAIVAKIVCRSSTIYERKHSPFIPIPSVAESLIKHRMDTWRNALYEDGLDEEMEKYFRWQEIDPQSAMRMLSPVHLESDAPLPAWAEVLEEVLTVIEDEDFWRNHVPALLSFAYNQASLSKDGEPLPPFPFDEMLAPFLDVIESRLSGAVGYDLLNISARQTILYTILKELANTASDVFYDEFQTFREKQPFGALILLVAKSREETPRTAYLQFVQGMKKGGLVAFLNKYSVLARLLCQLSLDWIKTQREFLRHLVEDMQGIQRTFQNGEKCGKIIELTLALSDRHCGGYSVMALTFESGLQLVYKPKDIRIESTYHQFLQWLNEHGSPVDFYPLNSLVCGTHGWVEFAEHNPCRDRPAVERFYQRSGALLCLLYVLEATDCHAENIIAHSEYPLLIDAETLFQHRVEEKTTNEIRQSAAFKTSRSLLDSVLRVGLLPGWHIDRDRKVAYDGSGLGSPDDKDIPYQRKRFVGINTDAMEIVSESWSRPADKNIPFLEDGSPIRFEESLDLFIDAIGIGFEQMYRYLMQKRPDLENAVGGLTTFQDKQIRFIFRATQTYHNLSLQSRRSRYLQDGAEYSLYLERLARAHLQVEDKPSCFPLLNAEREALTNLDIPFFTASTGSANIELTADKRKWVVENYFIAPSYTFVMQRLQALNEEDLNTQLQIIRGSMYARFAHQNEVHHEQPSRSKLKQGIFDQKELEPETAISQALTLARRILSQKVGGGDGSSNWYGIQLLTESGRFQFGSLNVSLYDGVAGIGMFLAALEKVLQSPEYRANQTQSFREEALACSLPVRQSFKEAGLHKYQTVHLGGANGIGSSIYALLKIGKFLAEPALIEEAQAEVLRIPPELIEKDDALDIISGGAGFILCLLALYEETKNQTALDLAILSGKHLLSKRITTEVGFRVWKTVADRALSGFSHGAAGFAHSLIRLYQYSHEQEFLNAAEEAIAYEDTLFSEQECNWRDLRNERHEAYMVAWCHGAAGIGMQRAYSLNVMDTPQVRQDIEAAITTTQRYLSSLADSADHLCCGNLGRIEAIFSIGRQLERPDLINFSRQCTSLVIENAADKGDFLYTSYLPRNIFSAGFFQGGAGIGYELLRLAHPEILPNVLVWE